MLITEHFESFQGTGINVGIRQHFVRLAGCSVPCPIRSFCDEGQALDRNNGRQIPVELVVNSVECDWIHITGGEPLEQMEDVKELVRLAKQRRIKTQIQTSGTIPYFDRDMACHITVSPKARHIADMDCTEIVVVYDPKWITMNRVMDYQNSTYAKHHWICPAEIDGDFNTLETIEFIKQLPKSSKWRLTGQFHKWWGVS